MLTLFHASPSRSTRVIALLHELDALDVVQIETVSIPRLDGSGARDPANPHPEGKVPLLVHDGVMIRESGAILLYLADLFPQAQMNIPVGHRLRGAYLSWFAWYAGVMEPVLTFEAAHLQHPLLKATFRDSTQMRARLMEALADRPFLMGDHFTAADLLLHSPFAWFGKTGDAPIDAWVDRCCLRPGAKFAFAFDQARKAVPA